MMEGELKSMQDLSALWQALPGPDDKVWQHISPSRDQHTRKREAYELLAAALWHLELAHAVGPISGEPLTTPVALGSGFSEWARTHPSLTVERDHKELVFRYQFLKKPDLAVYKLIQNMLVADAVLRVYGAREVLGSIIPKTGVLAPVRSFLEDTGSFKPNISTLQQQTVLLIAFRDSYMHGEVSDAAERIPIRLFRETCLPKYSLADIGNACITMWEELAHRAREINLC